MPRRARFLRRWRRVGGAASSAGGAGGARAEHEIEAAEVLEHFQWDHEIKDRPALASELADVTLYLLQLASLCQIDLEGAVLEKLAANYNRSWPENRVK